MKKSKILVPALAVLALGIAGATTSTVAWFAANANAQISPAAAATGNLSVSATTASITNNFTITPSSISASVSLAYTDASGKTYVSVPNGDGTYTTVEGTAGGSKVAAYELKATVTYSGTLEDKAAVKALWESEAASVTLTMSCESASGTVLAGAPAKGDVVFVSGESNFSAGDNAKTKTAASFVWSDATTTAELSFGTVYVALRGSDALVVDATHLPTYGLEVAASFTAA